MDEQERLIAQMQRIVGYVPVGTKDLLNILVHPDLIHFTEDFINSRKDYI